MANGAKLTQGWSDAYEVDFTQGGGGGDRPIVLSYDSSPAFTVDGQGGTTTSALLDTCFRQVEYAGVLAGAREPGGRRGAGRLHARAGRSRRRCRTRCTSSRSTPAPTLPPDWAKFAPQPDDAVRRRPGRDRREPRRVAARVERRHQPVTAQMRRGVRHPRRPGARAGAGARRLLRAAGQRDARRGLLRRRHASTPAGVAEVLARPRTHRVLWFTVWSAGAGHARARVLLGLPAAYVLHRLAFPCRGLLRALLLVPFVLPTVVVGVAFRQLVGESGPLGFLGLDGTAGRDRRRPRLLQRRRRDPRGRRRLGVARPAAGRGGGRARREPGAGVPHGHAARPCGRRSCRAASVVFLFCATSFGVVLTLGGLRYSSVETEIYLLTTQLLDLQAAAALSIVQLLAVTALLVLAGRLRAVPDPTVDASYGAPAAAAAPGRRPAARSPLLVLVLRGGADRSRSSSARCASTTAGALDNYRALTTVGARQRAAGPGHRRAGHLAADRGRRDLDGAAARRVWSRSWSAAARSPAASAGCAARSTASSCCRSASPR